MENTSSGRPVRFFVVLMSGWVIVRIVSGVFATNIPAPFPLRPIPVAAARMPTALPPNAATVSRARSRPRIISWPANGALDARQFIHTAAAVAATVEGTGERADGSLAPLGLRETESSAPPARSFATFESPASPPALPLARSGGAMVSRWQGSVWLLWREGSGNLQDLVTGGRLGGSQAGLRLDYDLTQSSIGRAAIYGRVSSAFNRPASPESAVGVTWQPTRSIPLSIAAERRFALGDGARNANALFAVGGFGPRPVLGKLEAEAYAQAGVVGFHRRDLFADGKLSLLAPISRTPIRTGLSFSGGAQPQVERLDIGPELQFRLPLPHLASRISIEWRERVAGQASPSSGLAVTLGADF